MVELNQEKGTTFLFSTHDQHVMSRARQLLLLTDGRITYAGNCGLRPAALRDR